MADGKFGSLGSASWWIDLAERTIRDFAHSTAGALFAGGVNAAISPIFNLPWTVSLEIGASSAAPCALTGFAGITIPFSDPNTASWLPPPEKNREKARALLVRLRRRTRS